MRAMSKRLTLTIGLELDEEVDVAVGGEVVAERTAEHREPTNTAIRNL